MHLTLTKELDIIGATFSFLSTLFYMAASRWAWPVSLIAISINMVLYTKTGLFADVFKESIYAVSCMIGWYWWRRGGKHQKTLAISNLSLKHSAILSIAALLSTLALSTVLIKWTSSQVPYWDATTTILSLTAQWLICRKIIECWILWGIVDGLYTLGFTSIKLSLCMAFY